MTSSATHACYDHPRYWDQAFSDETIPEADFIDAVAGKYCPFSVRKVLEPGCGGGRQVLELSKRGYQVSAFDLNQQAVEWTRQRLRRNKLSADICVADMKAFQTSGQFDLAHCFVNSFRHLTSEAQAVQHLCCVADSLRTGGLYLLGLHLLPPDAAEDDCERWTITTGNTRVTTTVRVLEFSRRKRLETVRFCLRIRTPKQDIKLRSDHLLRIYRADQMRSLLKKVPQFQLLDVFDFCYDVTDPLQLNDDLGDTVLILQKQ